MAVGFINFHILYHVQIFVRELIKFRLSFKYSRNNITQIWTRFKSFWRRL